MVQSKRLQNNKISSKIHTKGTMSKINNTINRKTTIKNKFQNKQQRNYKKTKLKANTI